MEEQVLRQSIEQLIKKVPAPVRSFILEELPAVSDTLMTRHKLHIDQGGVLETELLLMLLGQSAPKEFVAALADAGIDEGTVRNISADVNIEIFAKLQKKEREQGGRIAVPIAQPPREMSRQDAVPAIPVAPLSSGSVDVSRQYESRIVSPPSNLPGQAIPPPTLRPAPPPPHIDVPAPPPAPPAPPQPQAPAPDENTRIIHTMARDMQALKSGEDPFRVAHPAPPAWAITPSAPIAPSATMQAAPTPPPTPEPARETPPAHNEPLRAHLKQYGVDPYREPVE